jgi:hypothetical protein
MRDGGSRASLGTKCEAIKAASSSRSSREVGEPGPDEGVGEEAMGAVGGGEGRVSKEGQAE